MSIRLLIGLFAVAVPGAVSAQGMVQPLGLTDADRLATQMRQLAANPRDLNALATAGELSMRVGDLSGAAALFARADKVDPRSGRVKAGMAAILVRSERPGEALRFFGQAEAYGWPVARFAADRGLAYDLIGEQERAQRDYRLALRNAADDETARRYGLSLAISGRQKEALQQLDPLVRRQDRAAWRARAFVLAMGGDTGGAAKIATAMMPPSLAQGLGAFFGRLPTLGPVDRAFAVHFGEIFATPARIADARLAPTLAPLAPEPGVAPVQVAAAAPVRDRRSRRERERDQRRERERTVALARVTPRAGISPSVVRPAASPATQVAAVAPRTLPPAAQVAALTPQASLLQVPAEQPRALPATMRESDVRVAAVPLRPVPVAGTSAATISPAPLAGSLTRPAASAAVAAAVVPTQAPITPAGAVVSLAPPTALTASSVSGPSLSARSGGAMLPVASPVLTTAVPASAGPVATGLASSAGAQVGATVPQTLTAGSVPVVVSGPALATAPATPVLAATPFSLTTASTSTIVAAPVGAASSAPFSAVSPTPAAVTTMAVLPSTSLNAGAAVTTAAPILTSAPPTFVPAAPVAGPPAPVLPVETAAATERTDSVLARIVASLSIPASELGIAPVRPDPSPVPIPAAVARAPSSPAGKRIVAEATAKEARDASVRRTVAAKLTGDPKADDPTLSPRAKRAAAAKALADRKAADEKKALAAAAAEEKRIARTKPARIWVQVAGGANETALAKAWRTAQNKAPALKSRIGYSTPLRATNRVLTGPFKTEAEARALVNQLAREGVSAFSFTSEAGQDVKTLGSK